MKSTSMPVNGARTYRPKEHWTGLAQGIPSADASGFAPVLHPDAPAWFNRLIDNLQFRAVRRALAMCGAHPGARILDVGCGTGRWLRRYQDFGLVATGVDVTAPMLWLARERGTLAPLAAGEAQRLPFADAWFDLVSDITVIQHIPTSLQAEALSELVRVLKPGGFLILMELIRGEAAHIFPRSAQGWIELAASSGVKLTGWFGQEYLLLDRFFVRVAQTVGSQNGRASAATQVSEARVRPRSSAARRIYWAVRHVMAPLSAWVEPVVETICPKEIATHGVLVFQK